MPVSFTKAAIMHAIGGLLGTLIRFGIISAMLSLTLYLVAWSTINVQMHTGGFPNFQPDNTTLFPAVPQMSYTPQNLTNTTIFGFLQLFNPSAFLSQFPPFKNIGYIQMMWYALLVPVIIGGSIHIIMLSQGNATVNQQVVDFYGDVAWPTILITGLFLLAWLLFGAIILIGLSAFPQSLVSQGLGGLIRLNMINVWSGLQFIFTTIFPYLPVPVEVGAFIYMLKEVHTGWVGNQW